jgi:hypothetical protein
LGIDLTGRFFGTGFAPGVNVLRVHCLIVRDDIVSENQSALSDSALASAIEIIRRIIPDDELERKAPTSPTAVYTTTITIWMLILQRLGKGRSLTNVVKDVLSRNRQLLPDNKRVRENTLSETSGAYSNARKRLPLQVVKDFATHVCESFVQQTPSSFGDRQAFIIDATTMTLSPTSELRDAYPPATNQHGEDVEHDIRDFKVSMALETIRCRSDEMVKKELSTSVVAYNLVVQFRRQAAQLAQLPPRRLSFKDVWYTFQPFLLHQPPCTAPQ